jgi:2-C-methyl-D-erythritol 4-phosphate cytidylyltransferase
MTTFTVGAEPRCFALVPAAGVGARSGAAVPKQYVPLAGRAMLAHTLEALQAVPGLAAVLVVLAPDDDQFEAAVPVAGDERLWLARCGGATRAESVARGLHELIARGCLLRPEWVRRLIDACGDDEVGGLLALPLADTLKQESHGRVMATVDRNHKWAAQTPQMFRLGLLKPALAHAGEAVTDEASAIESLGHAPLLVPGELENFKITWPGDFALAERLLRSR